MAQPLLSLLLPFNALPAEFGVSDSRPVTVPGYVRGFKGRRNPSGPPQMQAIQAESQRAAQMQCGNWRAPSLPPCHPSLAAMLPAKGRPEHSNLTHSRGLKKQDGNGQGCLSLAPPPATHLTLEAARERSKDFLPPPPPPPPHLTPWASKLPQLPWVPPGTMHWDPWSPRGRPIPQGSLLGSSICQVVLPGHSDSHRCSLRY